MKLLYALLFASGLTTFIWLLIDTFNPSFLKSLIKRKPKSIAKLRDETWKYFSIYIRTKYANWKGEVQCVTCNKWLLDWDYKGHVLPGWKAAQAGHFIPGRRPSVLFDERNVHPQCGNCNVYLHGNLIAYYPFMQKKYGEEVIAELKKLHWTNKQFTKSELEDLAAKYKKLVEKYLK